MPRLYQKNKQAKFKKNPLIFFGLLLIFLLAGLGLLFVFEASVAESFATFGDSYHLVKQAAIGMGVGFLGLFVALLTPTKTWLKLSPVVYAVTLLMLVLVFFPGIGLRFNGANRWLNFFGTAIQPVEFFKFGLVAYFASWLAKHQRFGPFLLLTGLPLLLLLLQPDLGSFLLVVAIACAMFFAADGQLKQLAIMSAVGLPILVLSIVLAPYRLNRVLTFLNPELDPLGKSFHIRQITLALGRGGWLGQGIGNSSQRFSYIPEASTDSIFSIVGEEVGFLGSLVIMLVFALLFGTFYKIVTHPSLTKEQYLLGMGILLWIAIQTILNLAAVSALVPLTGVPLPFFSYGRSSLIMILFASGVVLRLAREVKN